MAANDAVYVNTQSNGKTAEIHITNQGSDFYYGVCGVMGIFGIAIMFASLAKPKTDRVFFYLCAAINLTACVAYYSMGSNLGWTPIDVEFPRDDARVAGINREIFYVRYVDWFITTPLLILDLMLTASVPWPTIAWTIFMDIAMIVLGLVGALVKSKYKWGFFGFGCGAMSVVFYNLLITGRKFARHHGSDVSRVYNLCGVWTIILWLAYPICWGVSEGGNVISPDGEAVYYGVLDILAKCFFSVALLAGHWRIDPARLGLKLRGYDDTHGDSGVHHHHYEVRETSNSAVPAATTTAETTTAAPATTTA